MSAEEVTRATLKNGMRVVVVRNTLAPVVTTEMNYLAGSNEAPPGFPGMAHAQEHMMFRGSRGLSESQLATIIADMGGRFDADTQQTVTQYYFIIPAKDLEIALHIESIRMTNVLDEEELWKQERGAIDQEVSRDLSNPEYVFYTRLLEAMFRGTPYSHDALGTHASFAKTTGEMLKEFHGKWYAPNNAILVIVGDVDPADTIRKVRCLFEPVPSRPLPARPEIQLSPMKAESIEMSTDLPYGLSVVAYRLPGYESPDYAAGQVLSDVLASRRADIYRLVPAGKAIEASFSSESLPLATIAYAAAAFPQGEDGEKMVSTLKDIIAGYAKQGVPADLIEAAKLHKVTDTQLKKNSISGLADLWSRTLAVEGRNSPEDNVRAIQAVTVADVNRVARQYLVNDTAVTAILKPTPSSKPVASRGYGGAESFTPTHVKPVKLPQWAEKVAEAATVPPSNLNPTSTVLPNGLRLIVQPENISPTVSVHGLVRTNSGVETPEGQEGISDILDTLFSYGTTSLDRVAFQKALDDIGARESAGVHFSLKVLTEHVDRGMQLLSSNLLQPALPEAAFKVVQKEKAASVAGELQSPRWRAKFAMTKGLYPPHDPELRHPTPSSVASLSIADVRNYYRKAFRPDLTTIVVIGQITPEKARALVEKHFGSWKAVGPAPPTELPSVPNNKPSATRVPDPSRIQDDVFLEQTIDLTRSNPAYYALELGNHVLSGAFYATRLYRDLRETTGLVYTVESTIDAGKTRSRFSVAYACDPSNVDGARAIVERNLRQMQTAPITQEELDQARTLLVRRVPLSESSVDDIASQFLEYSRLDLPLNEKVLAAKRYGEISAKEVQEAFARWIRPGDFVQVTLGPAPNSGSFAHSGIRSALPILPQSSWTTSRADWRRA